MHKMSLKLKLAESEAWAVTGSTWWRLKSNREVKCFTAFERTDSCCITVLWIFKEMAIRIAGQDN